MTDPAERYILPAGLVWMPDRVAAELYEQLADLRRHARDSGYPWSLEASAWLDGVVKTGRRWREQRQAEISGSEPGTTELVPVELAARCDRDVDAFTVAALAGVSEAYVRRLGRDGTLSGRKVAGSWRFDLSAVDRWLEDRGCD